MSTSRVLFKIDPRIVVAERTEHGVPPAARLPAKARDPFERFPFAAAVCAGIPWVRDIASPEDHANLWQIEDDELVEAIDRDRALRAAADTDAVVVDDPDA